MLPFFQPHPSIFCRMTDSACSPILQIVREVWKGWEVGGGGRGELCCSQLDNSLGVWDSRGRSRAPPGVQQSSPARASLLGSALFFTPPDRSLPRRMGRLTLCVGAI
jgi:hypothetical protein